MNIWGMKSEDFTGYGEYSFRFVDFNGHWVYIQKEDAVIQDTITILESMDASPLMLEEEINQIRDNFKAKGKYRIWSKEFGVIWYAKDLNQVKKYISDHICQTWRRNWIGLPAVL
jgi:hypothetical protein